MVMIVFKMSSSLKVFTMLQALLYAVMAIMPSNANCLGIKGL